MKTICSLSSIPSCQAARKKAEREARARRRARGEKEKEKGKEEEEDDDEATAAKTSRSLEEASKSHAAAASEPATAAAVTAQSRRLVASRGAVCFGGERGGFVFGERKMNFFGRRGARAEIEGEDKKSRRRLFFPFEK